jgi:hypothetical protein
MINTPFAPYRVPRHVYTAATVVADYFAAEDIKDWQINGIGPVKGNLPTMCDASEYQPLDPKQWLDDPEGLELEFCASEGWIKAYFPPTLNLDGKLKHPDLWRMRRKPKQTVLYFYMGDRSPIDWWTLPNPAATHIVTFGPRQADCGIKVIGKNEAT